MICDTTMYSRLLLETMHRKASRAKKAFHDKPGTFLPMGLNAQSDKQNPPKIQNEGCGM